MQFPLFEIWTDRPSFIFVYADVQKDPMALFRLMKGFFLDELLCHEGLGDNLENPRCAHCACSFDTQDPNSPRLFKCFDCGQFLQCEDCCVSHHQRAPLHVIEVCVLVSLLSYQYINRRTGMEWSLLDRQHTCQVGRHLPAGPRWLAMHFPRRDCPRNDSNRGSDNPSSEDTLLRVFQVL